MPLITFVTHFIHFLNTLFGGSGVQIQALLFRDAVWSSFKTRTFVWSKEMRRHYVALYICRSVPTNKGA